MPLLTDAKCDCDWPVLWEVGNPVFLGRLTTIRLCCLMKFIEQTFELSFHETRDAEPMASWNAELTGKGIPEYLERRIEEKRVQGFAMDAPQESEDLQIQMEAIAKNGGAPDADGSVSGYIENGIRRTQPNDEGLRKSWQRA
jgi:hypothetical protein